MSLDWATNSLVQAQKAGQCVVFYLDLGYRVLETEFRNGDFTMIALVLRHIASRDCFLAWFVFVLVAAPLPLWAEGKQAQDLGATNASKTVTASIVLRVHHPELLEAYVTSTQDPTSDSYHQFLSLPNFVSFFAPNSGEIFVLTRYLNSFGIQVTDVYADQLLIKATGTVDAFNKAFSLEIHDFARDGTRFHRPSRKPRIPLILRDILVTIIGPSDEAQFRPRNVRLSDRLKPPLRQPAPLSAQTVAPGSPQQYTVGFVADHYDINPLYQAHIDGRGQTVGIATLANFIPQDAYDYWSLIGLSVLPDRITQVHVDGGGQLSAAAGSGETSLDVEQSGGLAPQAKIIVYDAPNTSPGFVDLFYKAASDNLVDSLSVSWGEAEVFYFQALAGEDDTGQLLALHQAFLELAAQGISAFSSAGDNGAYDIDEVNTAYENPFNNVLTVDYPASDPAITAAGGTTTPVTLPATSIFKTPPPHTPPLVVSTEQVWGWDYLQDYLVKYGGNKYQNVVFPVGGGGGVSIFWPLPAYQNHTSGVRLSEPGQSVIYQGQDLLDLPANYAGRNLPDLSLNADPESGYLLLSTEDGGLLSAYGGTSFVAPQLNGISALISQVIGGGRLGLWNPMLYRFQRVYGYGKVSPFVDITAGDNWFYYGIPGYEPGAGIGVPDVTKLAIAVALEAHNFLTPPSTPGSSAAP
jgi:kumamolisin